ncbi:MAG: hypothetical protein [Circoviridae sp.]|nr:MAG: hypothetical protein [Circoviridae sp.]
MIKIDKPITLFGDSSSNWFLDQNSYSFNKPINRMAATVLGNSSRSSPWRPCYKIPWETLVSYDRTGLNLSINVNPDIKLSYDCKDPTIMNPKMLTYLWDQYQKGILLKCLMVSEFGERGPINGKLHYHMAVKLKSSQDENRRELFEKGLLDFTSARQNCKHITLKSQLFRTVADRDRYIHYLHKEPHNTLKCMLAI